MKRDHAELIMEAARKPGTNDLPIHGMEFLEEYSGPRMHGMTTAAIAVPDFQTFLQGIAVVAAALAITANMDHLKGFGPGVTEFNEFLDALGDIQCDNSGKQPVYY